METVQHLTSGALEPFDGAPRVRVGRRLDAGGVTVGEWSMTAAAWTDRHDHVEVNTVLAGELHVTWDGGSVVAGAGDTVAVPAGVTARYAAPTFARMLFVYGPGPTGSHVDRYEELPLPDGGLTP